MNSISKKEKTVDLKLLLLVGTDSFSSADWYSNSSDQEAWTMSPLSKRIEYSLLFHNFGCPPRRMGCRRGSRLSIKLRDAESWRQDRTDVLDPSSSHIGPMAEGLTNLLLSCFPTPLAIKSR